MPSEKSLKKDEGRCQKRARVRPVTLTLEVRHLYTCGLEFIELTHINRTFQKPGCTYCPTIGLRLHVYSFPTGSGPGGLSDRPGNLQHSDTTPSLGHQGCHAPLSNAQGSPSSTFSDSCYIAAPSAPDIAISASAVLDLLTREDRRQNGSIPETQMSLTSGTQCGEA